MKGRAESGLSPGVNMGGTTLAAGVVEAAGAIWSSCTAPIGRLGRWEGNLKTCWRRRLWECRWYECHGDS
jgi:hypothetical protein